jgi:hypothetical protein
VVCFTGTCSTKTTLFFFQKLECDKILRSLRFAEQTPDKTLQPVKLILADNNQRFNDNQGSSKRHRTQQCHDSATSTLASNNATPKAPTSCYSFAIATRQQRKNPVTQQSTTRRHDTHAPTS